MDLTHQLTPMLRTLRLSGILETLEVRNRQAVEQQVSFVEFLTLLLQDEVERRAQSKLRLRLRRAAFDPTKTLEGFDFSFNPKLNKAQFPGPAVPRMVEMVSARADSDNGPPIRARNSPVATEYARIILLPTPFLIQCPAAG